MKDFPHSLDILISVHIFPKTLQIFRRSPASLIATEVDLCPPLGSGQSLSLLVLPTVEIEVEKTRLDEIPRNVY
jgi:hypothetical protein